MAEAVLHWLETRRGFWVTVASITGLAAVLRMVRFTFPSERVFDEVYSPKFAWDFLQGEDFFDVHPILVELQHLPGLLLFGDTPLGWRFSPWLWMIVFTLASAYAVWLISRRRIAGIIMAALISLDTTFFVYGRTGLPDMFLMSQLALAVAFFFLSIRLVNRSWAMSSAAVCGIFLGNVISTKWSGAAAIASVWLWIITVLAMRFFKKANGKNLLPRIPMWTLPVWFLVIPVFVYGLWLIPLAGTPLKPGEFITNTKEWHQSVHGYHAHLDATHPYSSEWWEWPIVRNPVRFFYKAETNGARIIDAAGNTVLWWGGFAAIIIGSLLLFQKFRIELFWIVGSALFFWIPWAFIGRVAFNYHYFPTFFFSLIALSLFLGFLLGEHKNTQTASLYRVIAVLFFVAAGCAFILMYPSTTALLVSR